MVAVKMVDAQNHVHHSVYHVIITISTWRGSVVLEVKRAKRLVENFQFLGRNWHHLFYHLISFTNHMKQQKT